MMEVCSTRFPHSDISGSMDICSSPKLFAAYHVFHRLLVPRHPPCALISLTFWFIALNHRAVFTRVIFRYLFLVNCFWIWFPFCFPGIPAASANLKSYHLGCLDIFSYHRLFNMQFSRYMAVIPVLTAMSFPFLPSGDGEIRTLDPLLARQVLSQLSYAPRLN